jgi:hypothetical protein
MIDRTAYSPMFTHEHGPQPNAVSFGEYRDHERTRPAQPTAPASGLHRVQSIGG